MSETCMKCRYLVMLLVWLALPALAETSPTATAVAGTWQPRAVAFARVSARQEAMLSLPFAARVVALDVEPGARVTAGDELARFDAPLLRQHLAAWDQSRRDAALARKRLQVLRENEQEHTITRRDLVAGEQALSEAEGQSRLAWEALAADLDFLHTPVDDATLALQVKKQGLQSVARNLGSLHAPFTGVVAARFAVLGQQLSAGDPVLELETVDRVYLEVGVPETALARWQDGENRWYTDSTVVVLTPLDAAPRYDASTGLWLLRFEAANPALARRDGAWVEVEHLGAAEPVIWVPGAAVVARNGKTWCVVAEGDRFKPVEVRVGAVAADGRIPVLAGLEAEVQVVTAGAYELLYRDLKELIRFED